MTPPTQIRFSDITHNPPLQPVTRLSSPKARVIGWTKKTAVSSKKPFTIIAPGDTHTFPKGTSIELVDEDQDVYKIHAYAKTSVTGPAIVRTQKICKKAPDFRARLYEPFSNIPRGAFAVLAGFVMLVHMFALLEPQIAPVLFLLYLFAIPIMLVSVIQACETQPCQTDLTLKPPVLSPAPQQTPIPQDNGLPLREAFPS